MASTTYYPAADGDFVVWYANFLAKLTLYATPFGVSTATLTAVGDDYAAVAYMINQVESAKMDSQDRVKFKHLLLHGSDTTTPEPFPGPFTPPAPPTTAVPYGVIARLRKIVKQIKANTAYTLAIGQAMGIEKHGGIVPIVIKPTGSLVALPGAEMEIKFVKRGFSGVLVESKRGSETAWTVLGSFVRSPLFDTRELLVAGQPETRSFRMRYLDGNNPVGQVSETLTATTEV